MTKMRRFVRNYLAGRQLGNGRWYAFTEALYWWRHE